MCRALLAGFCIHTFLGCLLESAFQLENKAIRWQKSLLPIETNESTVLKIRLNSVCSTFQWDWCDLTPCNLCSASPKWQTWFHFTFSVSWRTVQKSKKKMLLRSREAVMMSYLDERKTFPGSSTFRNCASEAVGLDNSNSNRCPFPFLSSTQSLFASASYKLLQGGRSSPYDLPEAFVSALVVISLWCFAKILPSIEIPPNKENGFIDCECSHKLCGTKLRGE